MASHIVWLRIAFFPTPLIWGVASVQSSIQLPPSGEGLCRRSASSEHRAALFGERGGTFGEVVAIAEVAERGAISV